MFTAILQNGIANVTAWSASCTLQQTRLGPMPMRTFCFRQTYICMGRTIRRKNTTSTERRDIFIRQRTVSKFNFIQSHSRILRATESFISFLRFVGLVDGSLVGQRTTRQGECVHCAWVYVRMWSNMTSIECRCMGMIDIFALCQNREIQF